MGKLWVFFVTFEVKGKLWVVLVTFEVIGKLGNQGKARGCAYNI